MSAFSCVEQVLDTAQLALETAGTESYQGLHSGVWIVYHVGDVNAR